MYEKTKPTLETSFANKNKALQWLLSLTMTMTKIMMMTMILMGSFTVEELLSLVLPPKQSLDQDLDPCKSPAFLGDIVYPEANLTIIKVINSIATTDTDLDTNSWGHGLL